MEKLVLAGRQSFPRINKQLGTVGFQSQVGAHLPCEPNTLPWKDVSRVIRPSPLPPHVSPTVLPTPTSPGTLLLLPGATWQELVHPSAANRQLLHTQLPLCPDPVRSLLARPDPSHFSRTWLLPHPVSHQFLLSPPSHLSACPHQPYCPPTLKTLPWPHSLPGSAPLLPSTVKLGPHPPLTSCAGPRAHPHPGPAAATRQPAAPRTLPSLNLLILLAPYSVFS